ncbi:MAG: hypothetical protein ACMXYK_05765 [Candidatus Woesearchaeota archaeon]
MVLKSTYKKVIPLTALLANLAMTGCGNAPVEHEVNTFQGYNVLKDEALFRLVLDENPYWNRAGEPTTIYSRSLDTDCGIPLKIGNDYEVAYRKGFSGRNNRVSVRPVPDVSDVASEYK